MKLAAHSFSLLLGAALVLVSGCAMGPDYRKPKVETPQAYGEAGPWKTAVPRDALPRAEWWKAFQDSSLDALENEAAASSPTLAAAYARVQQANAVTRASGGALFPSIAVNLNAARARFSGNREAPPTSVTSTYIANSIDLPLALNYELDLFGRVRRSVESARALAQAQAADYQNVLLSLQALVAETYFSLRELAFERDILVHTVDLRRQATELIRDRRQGGAAGDLDVYRAETELDSVLSDRAAADRQLASVRHSLAVLVGRPPERPPADPAPLSGDAPAVPVGLPSELLERRPDVAQAERNVAALNAQIGVAKAAFFPSVGLNADAGFNSTAFRTLLDSGSHEWSIGPLVSLPLFSGGRIRADYERSKAAYDEGVASYRARVLAAFQDVDNGLSDLRYLAEQAAILDHASQTAAKASDLSAARYKEGVADYFEVIDAQRTALGAELLAAQVRGQRFISTVLLIKALGGGW